MPNLKAMRNIDLHRPCKVQMTERAERAAGRLPPQRGEENQYRSSRLILRSPTFDLHLRLKLPSLRLFQTMTMTVASKPHFSSWKENMRRNLRQLRILCRPKIR